MSRPWPLTVLAMAVLLASLTSAPAEASLTVEAWVGIGEVEVSIILADMNASLYTSLLAARPDFGNTTIPEAIISYLAEQGIKDVYYRRPSLEFDNKTRTIRASFLLAGKGIMAFSYNKTTMARTYKVNASWRKACVRVRHGRSLILKLNFSAYFGVPLQKWEVVCYPNTTRKALFLNSTAGEGFDPIWYFVLPEGAEVVEARGDTFVFELPARPLDKFLASPFWPFMAVVLAVLICVAYRKAAVRFVRTAAS